MKPLKLILIILFIAQIACAQKSNGFTNIDIKALLIPENLTHNTKDIADWVNTNFQSETDKSRAIFIWVAGYLEYDVDNMFAINFNEQANDRIEKALKTRKGICEDYAVLYNDICSKAGIKSYLVEGYTKQNGFADYLPHAWCAAKIDTSWYLFDPTWGSGYVSKGKFYSRINNDYFKAQPAAFIKSHIPFDPLWEFLNYPVTNKEFYDGKFQEDKSKPFFDYNDSIEKFNHQTELEQWISAALRIESNGMKNSMIFSYYENMKRNIEITKQNEIIARQNEEVHKYNASLDDYNIGITALNDFIQYRNKQFNPMKSDHDIQAMIDSADVRLISARSKLDNISDPPENIKSSVTRLSKSIDDGIKQKNEFQDFLNKYFSKGKFGRKQMFYTK
jgi:hypothetical protein